MISEPKESKESKAIEIEIEIAIYGRHLQSPCKYCGYHFDRCSSIYCYNCGYPTFNMLNHFTSGVKEIG